MEDKFQDFKDKTRVLILSSDPAIAQLFIDVLNFNEKDFDFYLTSGESRNGDSDFVILETSDIEVAAQFHPNIALITKEYTTLSIIQIVENLTGGGVLVFPEELNDAIESTANFFRKLPFEKPKYQKSSENFMLETSLGVIPISNERILENIGGLQLLAQQFGVLEESFYEPVIEFAF